MASNWDLFLQQSAPCSLESLGAVDGTYKANDTGGGTTIRIVMQTETRKKYFNDVPETERFETIEAFLYTPDQGGPTLTLWATESVQGDSITVNNEVWYVRDYLERDAGGIAVILLASSRIPFGPWGGG